MSEAERVRYDRQVRLWGKTTQQRLMKTSVFFHGVGGESAEVAKNLVLAGVQGVIIDDPHPVTCDDLHNSMLAQPQDGSSGTVAATTRADAAVLNLRQLNPYVHVLHAGTESAGGGALAAESVVRIAQVQRLGEVYDEIKRGEEQQAGVVVLSAACGGDVLALFLFSEGHADSPASASTVDVQQGRALLQDPDSLQRKPAAYQRLVLWLHLRDALAVSSSSLCSDFAACLTHALTLVEELHLYELAPADVEDVVGAALCPTSGVSAVTATVAGASIAQHVVRVVGAAADVSPFHWAVCRTEPMEAVVGLA